MKYTTQLVLCLMTCSVPLTLPGQDTTSFAAVDQQVWMPFIESFDAYDAEGFNAVHDDAVLRGGPWGLLVGQEYFKRNIKNAERAKSEGNQRKITLTFEHRVHQEEVCYEVGYYRVVSHKADGTADTSYGQFHVVLRKHDGIWKIVQDWDASEIKGVEITSADFAAFAANGIYE